MSKKRRAKRAEKKALEKKASVWPLVLGIVGAILLFTWLANGGASGSAGPSPETIALGAERFAANCAVCHGGAAEGQDPLQPMGGFDNEGVSLAPALNGTGHGFHHSPRDMFAVIKGGSPLAGSPMEGWEGKMTDAEIRAVMSWLRSIWPTKIQERYTRSHGR